MDLSQVVLDEICGVVDISLEEEICNSRRRWYMRVASILQILEHFDKADGFVYKKLYRSG